MPRKIDWHKLDLFTRSYIEAALWASSDEESGRSFQDQGCDVTDIAQEALASIAKDCRAFQKAEKKDLAQAGDDSQNGHDFFLTRNRHGAGYWDRGYGAVGDRLSEAAHVYGSSDLYRGDDGKIYVM
jgi:hypothetical protein